MTGDDVLSALAIPAAASVDRRVPKTLLMEHGAPTAADRRSADSGIEQVRWVAALKPTTIGVAAWQDAAREYLEVAVLRVTLRPEAKVARLTELLHRAIPYPVLAVTDLGGHVYLSVAHKRWSQGEAERVVLDGQLVAVEAPRNAEAFSSAFKATLALSAQPQASLLAVYQGWMDTLVALQAARQTGHFEMFPEPERRAVRRQALGACADLDAEIARLRAAAQKETQMARQVEVNQALKRAEAARATVIAQL